MTTATKLEKYASMARPVTGPVIQRPSREVVQLMELRDNMLGVEGKAIVEVNSRIAKLQRESLLSRLQRESLLSRLVKKDLPYPRLSIEPLKWVKDGRPVFAMFALDSPVMRITKTYYEGVRVIPTLPEPIHNIYLNVPAITDHHITPYASYSLTARFTGVIPAPVRTEIKKAEPMFGKGMLFLVAEADFKARTISIDPLVVGWDGKSLRLITMFDLTTLEKELVG